MAEGSGLGKLYVNAVRTGRPSIKSYLANALDFSNNTPYIVSTLESYDLLTKNRNVFVNQLNKSSGTNIKKVYQEAARVMRQEEDRILQSAISAIGYSGSVESFIRGLNELVDSQIENKLIMSQNEVYAASKHFPELTATARELLVNSLLKAEPLTDKARATVAQSKFKGAIEKRNSSINEGLGGITNFVNNLVEGRVDLSAAQNYKKSLEGFMLGVAAIEETLKIKGSQYDPSIGLSTAAIEAVRNSDAIKFPRHLVASAMELTVLSVLAGMKVSLEHSISDNLREITEDITKKGLEVLVIGSEKTSGQTRDVRGSGDIVVKIPGAEDIVIDVKTGIINKSAASVQNIKAGYTFNYGKVNIWDSFDESLRELVGNNGAAEYRTLLYNLFVYEGSVYLTLEEETALIRYLISLDKGVKKASWEVEGNTKYPTLVYSRDTFMRFSDAFLQFPEESYRFRSAKTNSEGEVVKAITGKVGTVTGGASINFSNPQKVLRTKKKVFSKLSNKNQGWVLAEMSRINSLVKRAMQQKREQTFSIFVDITAARKSARGNIGG